ncbi:hypothetical protein [Streptosporangium sp. V21-05]|uniref:hypothetical protein n=1 Tax=Streptosporangium sp. V21-05 TaxID=3446115 RepID=UPI003F53AFF7
MNEHSPYTYVTASIREGLTRLNVSFHTPNLSVMVLHGQGDRPCLHLSTTEAQILISTTGGGPVTKQDVNLARQIADAAARYLAACERLHADQAATPMLPGLDEVAA